MMQNLSELYLHSQRSLANILIVDDQIENINLLSNLLTQEGYTVRNVQDGVTALLAAKTELPDLVLLDVQLPQMNGYEICRQLKQSELTQGIPVIFISAVNTIPEKIQAFEAGGADFISKPFQADEVLIRIRQQLTLHWQREQLRQQNLLLLQEIEERQAAELQYRSIFENSTEGIFQCSRDGRYLNVNPALARIYGYDSPEDLMDNLTNPQLYVEPTRREELIAYLQYYGHIDSAESQVYRKDGSTIWIMENIRVVTGKDGEFLYYEGTVQDVTERHQMEMELRQQRRQSDRLLVSILPAEIAQRLSRARNRTIADSFEAVTVLFADLVDFTSTAAQTSPQALVTLLNEIFSAFDHLTDKFRLEKIKTIGDAYMVAAGLPSPREDHAIAIAHMALAMQQTIQQFHRPNQEQPFQLRIGINTGPVVAGVIGIKKYAYDLWGDTVNIASRMESTGKAGRIQVAPASYELLRQQFLFKERGQVYIKGCGEMTTYWLLGKCLEEY